MSGGGPLSLRPVVDVLSYCTGGLNLTVAGAQSKKIDT